MPPDPELLSSLAAAVAAAPDDVALRAHLAGLLLEGARPAEALDHCAVILERQPDHHDALVLAGRAAEALGDEGRAAAYRRLAAALSPRPESISPAGAPVEPPTPLPAEAGVVLDAESEVDAFLAEVLGRDESRGERIRLADVGGMEEVKRRLETAFLGPLQNPELRRMYKKSLRGGLLMWGPPGCGKTFLARAVAGELGAKFLAVGLHEVLDMWLGKSEQNVHALFERARRAAPCVLFLDEVDALGMKRSNLAHSAGRNVVVQLLAELDGAAVDNEGLFLLAATNQPWDVDPALRRPGRLDRMLLVLPPDEPARRVILGRELHDRPVDGVDVGLLAASTDGFSGADLRALCETAAEAALAASIESGAARPIGMGDFRLALADVRPSTRAWFDAARNYAVYANQSGVYNELLAYLEARHWT